jgi:hypothetical protein
MYWISQKLSWMRRFIGNVVSEMSTIEQLGLWCWHADSMRVVVCGKNLKAFKFSARHLAQGPTFPLRPILLRYLLAVCAYSNQWDHWCWLLSFLPASGIDSACWEAREEAKTAGHYKFCEALEGLVLQQGHAFALTGAPIFEDCGSVSKHGVFTYYSFDAQSPVVDEEEGVSSLDSSVRSIALFNFMGPPKKDIQQVISCLERAVLESSEREIREACANTVLYLREML